MALRAALLDDRSAVRVAGPQARTFLHDLVTSDVAGLADGEARFAALLQPQGKILFDFLLLAEAEDAFLIDVARDQAGELARRLTLYKLRAKVEIADLSATHTVAALWGGVPETARGHAFVDPRHGALGHRLIGEKEAIDALLSDYENVGPDAYHAHRIALAIPEAGRDFAFGEVFPHEADMDMLGGVDFAKGCFVGQEVVSRMQHRGTARKRFLPVVVDGPMPEPDAEIRAGETLIGAMGTGAQDRALALVRLDRADAALSRSVPLTAGEARLTLARPDWARFAMPGEAPADTA